MRDTRILACFGCEPERNHVRSKIQDWCKRRSEGEGVPYAKDEDHACT